MGIGFLAHNSKVTSSIAVMRFFFASIYSSGKDARECTVKYPPSHTTETVCKLRQWHTRLWITQAQAF